MAKEMLMPTDKVFKTFGDDAKAHGTPLKKGQAFESPNPAYTEYALAKGYATRHVPDKSEKKGDK